jgi:nitroreductase
VDAFDAILSRRSAGRLTEPAPSESELRTLLAAAAAAPDHGELRPFRFIVLRGEGKDAFGSVLADAYVARCAADGVEPDPAKVAKDRVKLGRAPLVVVVAAVRVPSHKIPFEEQENAAAAAAQNLLLAATALGYGSMWRTGPEAYDPAVKAALGLSPDDAIVGFVYLGTRIEGFDFKPRTAPDLDDLLTEWIP